MITILIILDVFLFITIIAFIIAIETHDKKGLSSVLCIVTMIASFLLFIITDVNTIQPLDVYRGDTTLKITYVDSIPVDTTVVWKKDYNK